MISPARERCTRRSAMLTQSPKATNCCAPIGPAWPNTASPRCTAQETAAGRPYCVFHCSPSAPNSRCRSRAALIERSAKSFAVPVPKAPSSASFCTESTLPLFAVTAMAQKEKNSFASSSTFSGGRTSESRVKLRSSAYMIAAVRRSASVAIARRRYAVQVVLPDVEISLACCHDRVFHAELAGEFFHGAPAGIGVLDVRLGMELEELEILVRQLEEPAPASALEPEPAPLPQLA